MKNINWHLSVAVASRDLHSSPGIKGKANNPKSHLEKNKESPSLNLDTGVKYIIHILVFLSQGMSTLLLLRFTYITNYFKQRHEK